MTHCMKINFNFLTISRSPPQKLASEGLDSDPGPSRSTETPLARVIHDTFVLKIVKIIYVKHPKKSLCKSIIMYIKNKIS